MLLVTDHVLTGCRLIGYTPWDTKVYVLCVFIGME